MKTDTTVVDIDVDNEHERPYKVKIFSPEWEESVVDISICPCCLPKMLVAVMGKDEFLSALEDLDLLQYIHTPDKSVERLHAMLDSQAGEEPYTINSGSKETVQQTVGFTDQNPAYSYAMDSMPDSSFAVADTGNQSLQDFMCRPLRIAEYDWATTDPAFLETFNPWSLFFEDPKVINRIANFNLLRCKMHLKFQINGNGFHYGRLIAAYLPLHTLDNFTKDRAFFREDIIAASQQPHIYLDPTTSQGGDMCLPFFWYKNALSIPTSEWGNMGTVTIRSLNNLKHANGATDSVTISVWAWAEDVSLSIPTSENPDTLSPQMGEEVLDCQAGDEYGTGPISRPASILARAAGALVNAPVIGMYARATEMAASAVSAIATTFGYSRPAILSDITPYKPTLVGNMSNTNCPDSVMKLTVDAKQETTIDPRVTGLSSADEMGIKEIAKRETYITRFPWQVVDTPTTLLFSSKVTPMMWDELSLSNNTEIHMTASAFAVHPFRNWRGSMKFRFQVVASNFHKGRLRIVYDPRSASTGNFNTAFTQIVDIAEEKDITMEIGWGVQEPYATRANPGTDALQFINGASGPVVPTPYEEHNGIVYVEVLNSLTVPNSTVDNDIEVNVFVSMCDDFEVANPDSSYLDDYTWFATPAPALLSAQAGEESTGLTTADKDDTMEPSRPMADMPIRTLAANISPTDRLCDICFGEKVASFRQMCKRYNLHAMYSNTNTSTNLTQLYTRTSGDFPYYRGYVGASAIHIEPVAGNPYNYGRMTILNYVTPAFVGRRGGHRYKTQQMKRLNLGNVNQSMATIERTPNENAYSEISTQIFFSNGSASDAASQVRIFSHGHSGLGAQSMLQNPVLEYELPYQQNNRFYPGKTVDMTTSASPNQFHQYKTINNIDITASDNPLFLDYVAGAEDFSLFFFTGCPVMYYAPTDPT